MKCSKCRTENPANAKFCENCGQPMIKVITPKKKGAQCPACGEAYLPKDKFCNNCGAVLQKKAAPQKARSTNNSNIARSLPRDERYRQAKQLALKISQNTEPEPASSPIVYIGEKII